MRFLHRSEYHDWLVVSTILKHISQREVSHILWTKKCSKSPTKWWLLYKKPINHSFQRFPSTPPPPPGSASAAAVAAPSNARAEAGSGAPPPHLASQGGPGCQVNRPFELLKMTPSCHLHSPRMLFHPIILLGLPFSCGVFGGSRHIIWVILK